MYVYKGHLPQNFRRNDRAPCLRGHFPQRDDRAPCSDTGQGEGEDLYWEN